MPKTNPYYIPKLPETEQIVYLNQNYLPQSYEEFMKTYEPNEEIEILAELEWRDRVLHGPKVGPGNEQSTAVVKFAVKATTSAAIAGSILATGGAAAPFVIGGLAATGGGIIIKEVAKDSDNEILEFIGETVTSTGINLVTGGLGSVGAVSTTRSLASNIARETVKNGNEAYSQFSLMKDTVELGADWQHAKHRDEGISYKSNCHICNR